MKISDSDRIPGQRNGDNGILSLALDFLKDYKLKERSGPMTAKYEIEDFKQSYEVYEAVFIKGNKKQIVEVSANSQVPVGVQIFDDGVKVISLKVLSFDYNKGIAKDKFKIPPD